MKLNPDNWFWCDLCKCVSYDYKCECRSSLCNCTGCEKCHELQKIVIAARDEGKAPSEEDAKKNNIKKFGSPETPEIKLMEKIFGEN